MPTSRIELATGILAVMPLIALLVYGVVYVLEYPLYYSIIALTLFSLGLKYNKYSFTASIVLNGLVALFNPLLGVLYLASWLLGIVASPKTDFIDLVLALAISIACLDYVLGQEYAEIIAVIPAIVLAASKTGIPLDKTITATSLAVIIVSTPIALSKMTTTYLLLDLYAATTITIILLVERLKK